MFLFAAFCILLLIALCAAVRATFDRLGIDVPSTLVYFGLAEWPPVVEPRVARRQT